MYFIKSPGWLKKIFSNYTWSVDTKVKELYLTFDDGPHPKATPFVLQQLDQFNAKGSFFCVGKNVLQHPNIYHEILKRGHSVGNHTNNHLNGWITDTESYLLNIEQAAQYISSTLFRPPYGRIKRKQASLLLNKGFKIIMWDVLSGDFDINISSEKCKNNVIKKSRAGSIIVFHDSEKALKHLQYSLPATLDFFAERGYVFKGLNNN